jgi:hypothetical protein
MDGLLGNEKWESKLETNIPDFAWGLVTDMQEGKTFFYLCLTAAREITVDEFKQLDKSVLAGCVFKKTTIESKVLYLSGIMINGKTYDIIHRAPFWASKAGTSLYTDDNVKEPVLSKSGMSITMNLSQTAKNFIHAVIKMCALPYMVLSERTNLWFGAVNPKNRTDETIAAEKQEVIDHCKFDPWGNYFGTVSANTDQVPIANYKGIFQMIEDRDMIASEYMACPYNLIPEVFGEDALSTEGYMKFREGQLKNAIGVVDLAFRYHVGKDVTLFLPNEKNFTLKWNVRRMIITSVLEKPHDPMIPPPLLDLRDNVLNSFKVSEKTLAIVHKRDADEAGIVNTEEHDEKKLCLEDKSAAEPAAVETKAE